MGKYDNNNYTESYFDIKSNDYLVNFGKFDDISTSPSMIENGYIFYGKGDSLDDDYRYGIYDLNNQKEYKENINGIIEDANNIYYYDQMWEI